MEVLALVVALAALAGGAFVFTQVKKLRLDTTTGIRVLEQRIKRLEDTPSIAAAVGNAAGSWPFPNSSES